MQYDLIIIGAGPAATAAAVYAARKRLKTVVIAEEVGGQSSVSSAIYNWIGTPEISGTDLAKALRTHMEEYTTPGHTLTLMIGNRVESVKKTEGGFEIHIAGKDSLTTRTVLIASGSRRRKLQVPGADTFEHKGVMYCATCDGPLFSGMPVAVIGGGNAAFDGTLQLSAYASHVTLLHRSDSFRADQITIEETKKLSNVTILTNVEPTEIKGEQFVTAIVYKNKITDEVTELPVNAVFVEIGQLPNTELAHEVVSIDDYGKIIVDPMNQRTYTPGIWAAGDCTNGLYHQNNIAAGDAVKAIEDIYTWLKTHK